MSVIQHARHDAADLRRLAALGIVALDWRTPPADPMCVFLIDSDETANATLKDIVKGLAMAGIAARLQFPVAANVDVADKIVIRFAADACVASAADNMDVNVLPALTRLRGNAAVKRRAWSQLRALLRR